jgi:pyruvate,water dikinase
MVYRHHKFTISAVVPVGIYLANAAEWTGPDAGTLLAPLKGSTPVSLGAHEELVKIGTALNEAGLDSTDFPGLSALETLNTLQQRQDRVGIAVRAYIQAIGLRLAGGYDVADVCAIELPEMLIAAIWASKSESSRSGSGEESAARVRDAVPDRHRNRFDEVLEDMRRTSRLRDERGMHNDIWGTGIARQAILEAGRRLAEAGRIDEPENALDATHDEQVAMLQGAAGPSRAELQARTQWRRTASLRDVPPFLGPPPTPPPPLDGLPPHAAEAMRATVTAMAELFMPAMDGAGPAIAGKPVSPGVYIGTARVIGSAKEFSRLSKGDVLVTASTSPAFNVVLPLLGAIITDRGGQLSHAAIVAREYGIPAVVGTIKATSVIADGARVKVDGGSGRIDIL